MFGKRKKNKRKLMGSLSDIALHRPHSIDSFTHRKMTASMADRSVKTQKIRVIPISHADPDANRTEKIKVLSVKYENNAAMSSRSC